MILDVEYPAIQHLLLPMELERVSMLEVWPREDLVDRRKWSRERIGSNGLSCNQVDEIDLLEGNRKDRKLNGVHAAIYFPAGIFSYTLLVNYPDCRTECRLTGL